ncbi:Gamma-glutamyl phosphate reductase [uncultured delta proteobacterium]|uniref:Gamma-glutamyl phosphate reductase n=1 Tax=uncultured delta proteobacterium TaxID=34034 RepID=A0A212JGT4_9DELT|nr:Gamma-glutamyl phosphate reductase [uncultured delta proteobacterium]
MADSITDLVTGMGQKARAASRALLGASSAAKIAALTTLASLLEERQAAIFAVNAKDVNAAMANGLEKPKVDRLRLTPDIVAEMALACRQVAAEPDLVGAMDTQWVQPSGLLVGRMRIPLGVVAMIFESRPNVTIDSAILCIKSGNAVILRGGSEALESNIFLMGLVQEALAAAGLPRDAAQLVPIRDRETVAALCRLNEYVDVMIPRGGEGLIQTVASLATMPVLKHDKGVCHAYVDAGADLDLAVPVIVNSKAQRPSTCNALECLLIHRSHLATLVPMLVPALAAAKIEVRACAESLPLFQQAGMEASPAVADDFGMEFGDLILAVKAVGSMDEAMDHIARYGSRHTECIFSRDHARVQRFLRQVDASVVLHNASTRLNDGGQLGLGAEIGISTSKLQAYGPMGLRELTTTKFVVLGNGQLRK